METAPKMTPAQKFHQELAGIEKSLYDLMQQLQELKSRNYHDLPPLEQVNDLDNAFPKDF